MRNINDKDSLHLCGYFIIGEMWLQSFFIHKRELRQLQSLNACIVAVNINVVQNIADDDLNRLDFHSGLGKLIHIGGALDSKISSC